MNLEQKQKKQLEALESAWEQQIRALKRVLDMDEVDPERMKISLEAYAVAAKTAENLMNQMSHLHEILYPKEQNKGKIFKGVESGYGSS